MTNGDFNCRPFDLPTELMPFLTGVVEEKTEKLKAILVDFKMFLKTFTEKALALPGMVFEKTGLQQDVIKVCFRLAMFLRHMDMFLENDPFVCYWDYRVRGFADEPDEMSDAIVHDIHQVRMHLGEIALETQGCHALEVVDLEWMSKVTDCLHRRVYYTYWHFCGFRAAAMRYFGTALIPAVTEPEPRAMQMLKWRLQDAATMLALLARDTSLVSGTIVSCKPPMESYRGDMMRGIAALFSDFLGRLRDAVGAAVTDQPEDFVVFKMVLGAEVEVGAATSEGRYDQTDARKLIKSETKFLYAFAVKILECSMYDVKMPRSILLVTTTAQ
ncbi:hypothetical protein N3K66_005377 [Trichothecium roseum]|uniref:Uncharacterized protein n=1 Tax=Trichothecium roseum TaxID=47278 RepID=A0ACC0UY64_9HYPO|nr:hypothetical protein N3K66_005377 [Trichothecium roseum]